MSCYNIWWTISTQNMFTDTGDSFHKRLKSASSENQNGYEKNKNR